MNIQITDTLHSLGLTQSEVKVYLAILEQGKATVSTVASATGMNRRNIYDVLNTLLDKGLIFTIIGEKETRYADAAPEKLLEIIQSKEITLARILPELKESFEREHVPEKAIMYQGVEGFKQYLQDILNAGEDVRCVGAKGGWNFEELGDFAEWFEQERIKKKIKVYNLFDAEMRAIVEGKQPLYNAYAEHRFLPKEFSTNSAIDVFGNHVVTFTGLHHERFNKDVRLFVMVNQSLADAFRTWFQFMWDQCENPKSKVTSL